MSRKRTCLLCDEADQYALVCVTVCKEHFALLRGQSPVEEHHPVGAANGPDAIPLPANIHAALTRKMVAWPLSLKTGGASPLLQIARTLQVIFDFTSWLRSVRRAPTYLIALDAFLKDRDPEWWAHTDIAPLFSLKVRDD